MLEALRGFFATIGRGWRKRFVDPRRYGAEDGYRAADYWRDRLRKFGDSLQGPGHEGWSEDRNRQEYDGARSVLVAELDRLERGTINDAVLEVGPGTGYWTQLCKERGVRNLVAVDITDVQFPGLRSRFPEYAFHCEDASHSVPVGPFDLVLLLDVIEHVVTDDGLSALLGNLEKETALGGIIAISFPPPAIGRADLYYLRFWDVEQVVSWLPQSELIRQVAFRDGTLLLLRRRDETLEEPT